MSCLECNRECSNGGYDSQLFIEVFSRVKVKGDSNLITLICSSTLLITDFRDLESDFLTDSRA